MFILSTKLMLRLSFLPILIIKTMSFTYYYCEQDGNYTTNSTYRRNLDTALSALPTTNTGLGFFNHSTAQGNNRVNSVALCRGDVEPNFCNSCLNDSVVNLRDLCPYQKGAVGYYDEFWLKYTNNTILGNTNQGGVILFNTQNATDRDRFNGALRLLLSELRDDVAAGNSLRKFASENRTRPDSVTIYGYVQCMPNLLGPQCTDCLGNEINLFMIRFGGRIGGRILKPVCTFRYEIYRFFNGSTLVTSPPPSPSPSPSPPPLITRASPPVPVTRLM